MAKEEKAALWIAIGCVIICSLPLAIVSVVLGSQANAKGNQTCDYQDPMGLNVGTYLIGSGISVFIVMVMMITAYCVLFKAASAGFGVLVCVAVVSSLFNLAWVIIGGIILFRSNLDCIRNGTTHVVFALVMWCFAVLGLICNNLNLKQTHDKSKR